MTLQTSTLERLQLVALCSRSKSAEFSFLPRYFFNVSNSIEITDRVGTVLDNLTEARAHAIIAASKLLRMDGDQFWTGSDWNMQVKDDTDKVVCALKFSAATFGDD